MYAQPAVKRLQIMIEAEMDAALEREARSRGVSKAALIREFVGERLQGPPVDFSNDPIWQMSGVDDYEPEDIDTVVYGL